MHCNVPAPHILPSSLFSCTALQAGSLGALEKGLAKMDEAMRKRL
jgi:hypothetical protein